VRETATSGPTFQAHLSTDPGKHATPKNFASFAAFALFALIQSTFMVARADRADRACVNGVTDPHSAFSASSAENRFSLRLLTNFYTVSDIIRLPELDILIRKIYFLSRLFSCDMHSRACLAAGESARGVRFFCCCSTSGATRMSMCSIEVTPALCNERTICGACIR